MRNFVLKELVCNDICAELKNIGFDENYRIFASDKYRYKTIKIFSLSLPQANILKQIALEYGADCAVHRETITGKIETTDAIIGGSYSQLKKISKKLEQQPFSLNKLGQNICEFLNDVNIKTKLVGILNITPDSFSDGGQYFKIEDAQKHLIELVEDGADIIDIGSESTKPNFEPVESKEQIERLKPILNFINKEKICVPISIDTRSSEVAEFVLDNGASIINDVSGFEHDKQMANIIAKYNSSIVIQHSQKISENDNLTDKIFFKLKEKIEYALEKGIKNIILDPGIGFGKIGKQNIEIIERFEELKSLGYPIMIGISRKSFMGLENADNYLKDSMTLAMSYPLVKQGVDYLRVHNVKIHKQLLDLLI